MKTSTTCKKRNDTVEEKCEAYTLVKLRIRGLQKVPGSLISILKSSDGILS